MLKLAKDEKFFLPESVTGGEIKEDIQYCKYETRLNMEM